MGIMKSDHNKQLITMITIREFYMYFNALNFQVKVDGKWTLKDANGNDFVCFTVPIQID